MSRTIIIALVAFASACVQNSEDAVAGAHAAATTSTPVLVTLTPDQVRARTSPYVYDPYDRSSFPKLFARLGKPDPTQRIQDLREGAAKRALESGRCDRVELAEVSDTRSTNDNLVAFVDCTNRERFYVSESDMAAGQMAVANSQLTIDAGTAIERCVAAARAQATFPALMDPHIWTGSSFTTYKTMGSARVRLDFDATNAFGTSIPYTADCLFPAGSTTPELHIQPR